MCVTWVTAENVLLTVGGSQKSLKGTGLKRQSQPLPSGLYSPCSGSVAPSGREGCEKAREKVLQDLMHHLMVNSAVIVLKCLLSSLRHVQ